MNKDIPSITNRRSIIISPLTPPVAITTEALIHPVPVVGIVGIVGLVINETEPADVPRSLVGSTEREGVVG